MKTSEPHTARELLSVNEVRAVSGLGKTTVYKLINAGSLPAKKIGKKTVVLRRDVEHFLSSLPEIHGVNRHQRSSKASLKPRVWGFKL